MEKAPTDKIEEDFPSLSQRPDIKPGRTRLRLTSAMDEKSLPFWNKSEDVQQDYAQTVDLLGNPTEFEIEQRGKRLEELRNKYEGPLKQIILDYLTDQVDQGVEINLMAVARRLELATLIVPHKKSELGKIDERNEFFGHYNPNLRRSQAHTSSEDLLEHERHTALHELTHGASRHLDYAEGEKLFEGWIGLIGIGLDGVGNRENRKEKKTKIPINAVQYISEILNEAITEKLALAMIDSPFNSLINDDTRYEARKGEVKLLDRILEVGEIDFSIFLEAFFEEPDMTAEPGKRMPKWHHMQAELTRKFGPRFLQRLETFIDGNSENVKRLTGEIPDNDHQLYHMRQDWEAAKKQHGEVGARILFLRKSETLPLDKAA